ncbi:MAG: GLPGLI family protein [Chitinophagaceae bacterium]|nr:GLPGLI family protein [Chitinophagaceae bacterium]
MKKIFFLITLFTATLANAQQFIGSGLIEYEVRRNNHKLFGDGIWAEMAKDRFPQFSTNYYHLSFTDNKALYKYDHKDERTKMPWGNEGEDNLWFSDYNSSIYTHQKFVFDNTYLLSDTLMKIDWKLSPNETREIAGFNCRKATGIIFDSVYVFAFYTDEITVSGGPMGISGLPGMILGITIPRMFTSWVATKVQLTGYDPKLIVAPTKGKKKVAAELQENVRKATSDWGTWGQQQIWNIFL